MNKELMAARQKFRGQRGNIESGYNNTNIPEGKYTCVVTKSEIISIKDKEGETHPQHVIMLKVEMGDCKGRSLRPFPPYLDSEEGILSSAKNVAAILGDVVPGKTLPNGEFEVDFDDYLSQAEELAAQCLKETVEVTVKNSKKNKDDGTPWQAVYINRGLGRDAKGVKNQPSANRLDPKDNLDMGTRKRRVAKR